MDIVRRLFNHFSADPDSRGYAAMTDEQRHESLTVTPRQKSRGVIDAYLVTNAVTAADFNDTTDAQKAAVSFVVSAGQVDLSNPNVRNILAGSFAPGSDTRAALAALQNEDATDAEMYGFRGFRLGHVRQARSLG